MSVSPEEFNEYRSRMNQRILEGDNKVLQRFFNLDTNAYSEGHLPVRTKELIGLAASMVLRCDDCVRYHLGKCHELGFSKAEVNECLSLSLLIGGSIVIPHLRRAVEYWDLLESGKAHTKS
jgi:AhpD family alkylhydroperoxidase